MCGIVGGASVSFDELAAMTASLHHRGPDGVGHYRGGDFSLGVTRLAILDLEHGQQPFSEDHVHAICNGEIYNWEEIRRDLKKRGYRFRTSCDSEILPAAWLEWGTDLPAKLNGMFALAILDERKETLFLARDRCGEKPLFLSSPDSGPLRFASEIKALAAGKVALSPDLKHLSTWLTLRYLPEPETLFQNIQTLPAAHWCLVSHDGSREITRYWQPPRCAEAVRDGSIDRLDDLTRSAVSQALQSDVPIATYLSGGVDSALLGHYLRDLGAAPKTISIGFGAESDETSVAQATAAHLGLSHDPVQLTPSSLQDLPRVVSQMELPVGDTLILAFDKLASHTSALGAKVVLGGEGPDEHFGGYSFQKYYFAARKLGPIGRYAAAAALSSMPPTMLKKMAAFPAQLGREGCDKIKSYLRDFSSLSSQQQVTGLHSLFSPSQMNQLIHPDLLASQKEPMNSTSEIDSLNDLLATQYSGWLPDWSLIRQDRNSMAHSLEYRAPFLDHRLIDFAFSLPPHQKITLRKDKVIWRDLAARHLPRSITERPKQPFYLPLESSAWRTPFLTLAHDLLAPQGFTCHGLINPKFVSSLLDSTTFLPLKQLAAIVILQLWLNQNLSS